MGGTLWLVGTPIGNLGDLSPRARETLGHVDVIACEDTRRTRALLSHLRIRGARLLSFFEGNEVRRIPQIVEHLEEGRDVALVSEAGMPALSDPGYRLIVACLERGLDVDVVPGPDAAVAALAVSGLPTDRFSFEGFLPRRAGPRRARLADIAGDPRTLVLFESPRRLGAFLTDALAALGDRRAAIVRELTKAHQEVIRGALSELAGRFGDEEARGEVTVVIEGAPAPAPELGDLVERVDALAADGLSRKDAVARVAEEAGVSRRMLYEASLKRRA